MQSRVGLCVETNVSEKYTVSIIWATRLHGVTTQKTNIDIITDENLKSDCDNTCFKPLTTPSSLCSLILSLYRP
jgi:hypothetical protein